MKKFTFILAILLITCVLNAKNSSDWRNNFPFIKERISKITQRTTVLSKLLERQSINQESFLKSAATKQKLDSTVSRVLNTETQTWQNDYKDEFNYDSEWKNTLWLSKEWNLATKKWETLDKTELGYDNQKRVNSMLMYSLDSITKILTKNSKILVYYNSGGMQDSTIWYSTKTTGTTWIMDMKQIYYYNTSKQLIKTDVWSLDEEKGDFALSMKVAYTYTPEGKIKTSSTNFIMEGVEMLWTKTEYNYDTSGKLTSSENWSLSFSTFVLEKNSRTAYQYNSSGDVSVDTYSTWNGTTWIDDEKDESSYSTTNFSDVIFPSYLSIFGMNGTSGFSYNKAITGINTFQMLNGSWKNTDKTTFYYSSATSTNITEIENTLFSVYPNPASEQVNFSWKGNYESLSLEMYLITGAKVMEQITFSGKPVSISKLKNGIYFFRLLNGQQTLHAGKLIKK